MRRLRYGVATTLDGFIASPDGSTDWIVEDPSIDFAAIYAEHDTFVMGRKTYQVIMSLGATNPLINRPKQSIMVISRSMNSHDHPLVTVVPDNVLETIEKLKDRTGKDIWLMGGGQLALQCLEAGLVDTVEVAIMPVILGNGIKMIALNSGDGKNGFQLRLEQARALESGIIMTRYNAQTS
ncbi:hypothetical protein HIM_02841 [Hirsutella minnesotensis 3608]|nr:hypothetical protein HIM_02841 [Hirsutella minnesotensis 3608]